MNDRQMNLDCYPTLEALGEQFDAIGVRDATRDRTRSVSVLDALRRAPRFAAAIAVVAIVAAGTYVVPATRGAVDSVFGEFSDWLSGDNDAAPGHTAGPGDVVPSWVSAQNGEKRVLATVDGQSLVAIRQGDELTLALAGSAVTGTIDDLTKNVEDHGIVLTGAGEFLDDGHHDRRPIFGLVARSITRIDFNYADHSPPVTETGLTEAFGITIDTNRRPSSITGYDATGNLITRLDLSAPDRGDFRYCPDANHGCPPWPTKPTP